MLNKILAILLVTSSVMLCACSAPPEPPQPSGERVAINPPDFPVNTENYL